ncbi:precorrin-6A synthase (deacetylating) [Raineyella antarctica]|uniref:Precorrin-6A synthase (Deacetylating) n=1 Tax=Raineyella antarctica TaxID=1577474 RepID=A0A1G6GF12_9ACTN|nr:precorrin-6A synthase (deacetylating) [Raineyella antarctica]SDB80598.1 precorrin-6A synthase (deacetylating) [Raineyella antarctica]
MISTVQVIGIGTGDPGLVTYEAAAALREVDVFLVADKGDAKADLVEARRALCEHFIGDSHPYRFIEVPDPKRGPDAERDSTAYGAGVRDWHAARVAAYAAIIDQLPEGSTVGFLVWGDPAFYDSTLRIVDALRETSGPFEVRVHPGISAPQLLAARHAIPLNRIGTSIHVTTGRRLVQEYSPDLGDVVVMLDGHLACRDLVDQHPDLTIYWGAYLGGPAEVLRSGRLAEVIDELVALRAELREQHGWVMDTYLLRP